MPRKKNAPAQMRGRFLAPSSSFLLPLMQMPLQQALADEPHGRIRGGASRADNTYRQGQLRRFTVAGATAA